ncbi:hypothetical protein O9929_21640 [Vibrio lentus]|nr:hypothetical protein [Vibrio lentus]
MIPFWMTGEMWAHSVVKSNYFANGFDSIINFEFQVISFKAPKCHPISCFVTCLQTRSTMTAEVQRVELPIVSRHLAILDAAAVTLLNRPKQRMH